jgi:hypothetical protein
MNCNASWVVAFVMLVAVAPAGAQLGPGMTSPAQDQARAAAQDQARRDAANDHAAAQQQRQNAANQTAAQMKQSGEIKALREKLLRTAPLPAERNPLLGKWSVEKRPRKKDALADMFDSVVNIGNTACASLFGGGTTEFKATSWSSIDSYGSDSLGAIQYRGEGKRIWAMPAKQGVQLLGFDFVNPDRVQVVPLAAILDGCALVRIGASSSAGLAASGSLPPPSSAGRDQPSTMAGVAPSAVPAPPSTPPPSTPGRPSQEVCGLTFLDKLGVATFSPVRKALDVYYKETLHGTVPNSQLTRLDARGSGCDDPRIQATLYDFDANGTLQSITFVWARPAGPAPTPIFSERVHTLARLHSALPPPQSAGRLQADTVVGRLILQDMPERNVVLEGYAAKK